MADRPTVDPRHDPQQEHLVRALVAAHGTAVSSLLRRLEKNSATQEDLWAEVFAVAARNVTELALLTEGQVRGWLHRTARNLAANAGRRAVTRRRLADRLAAQPPPKVPSAESSYLRGRGLLDPHERRCLGSAWNGLPQDQRHVLALVAQGYDGREIARELRVSGTAARSRLMRARRMLLDSYDRALAAGTAA